MSNRIQLLILFLFVSGCSRTHYTPQAIIGIATESGRVSVQLKEKLSKKSYVLGFTQQKSDVNEEFFAKTNHFLYTFLTEEGRSFIMLGNITNAHCVRVSVYSDKGKEEADYVMSQLLTSIEDHNANGGKVTDNHECK